VGPFAWNFLKDDLPRRNLKIKEENWAKALYGNQGKKTSGSE